MERDAVCLLQRSTCYQNLRMGLNALVNYEEANTTLNSNLMLNPYNTHPGQYRKRRKRPMERLHKYVYGEPVWVQTDNLEGVICHSKPKTSKATTLRLARHKFQLEYIKRPSTPANLMVRVKTIWEPCLFQARDSFPL